MLLQMALFHSFLCLSISPLYIYIVEKGTTEDERVGWRHQLDGHEFEEALGVGDGQGSLTCCSPWGLRGRHE